MSNGEIINLLKELSYKSNTDDADDMRSNRYEITESELQAEAIHYGLEYLSAQPFLPDHIVEYIIQKVADMKDKLKCAECKSETSELYDSHKIACKVIKLINEISNLASANKSYQLNEIVSFKRPENVYLQYSVYCDRNKRRFLEDRHTIMNDVNRIFKINNSDDIISLYGIYDGHDGPHAAAYSEIHLPFQIVTDSNFSSNPDESIKTAFKTIDSSFIEKCEEQKLKGGTTALCILYYHKEKRLNISWVGDSRAILVKSNRIVNLVRPHKPEDSNEAERIRSLGGSVMKWQGSWRVNGLIAVSRAIGDSNYKPYISSDPDIEHIELNGGEDFFIMACDGLWDTVTSEQATSIVYKEIRENLVLVHSVAEKLGALAKVKGSNDNITVIVVFLKTPIQISRELAQSSETPTKKKKCI